MIGSGFFRMMLPVAQKFGVYGAKAAVKVGRRMANIAEHNPGTFALGAIGSVAYADGKKHGDGLLGGAKRLAVGENKSVVGAVTETAVGVDVVEQAPSIVDKTMQAARDAAGTAKDMAGDAYDAVRGGVGNMAGGGQAAGQQMPVYQDPYTGAANPNQGAMQQGFWNNVAGTGMSGWDLGKLGIASWMMFGPRLPILFKLLGGFIGLSTINDFRQDSRQMPAYQGGYPQGVQQPYAPATNYEQQAAAANEQPQDPDYTIHRNR